METIIIASVLLFAGYAIFSKFLIPLFKNSADSSEEHCKDGDDFYYEPPIKNPTTGLKMSSKSGFDASGKFYGEI